MSFTEQEQEEKAPVVHEEVNEEEEDEEEDEDYEPKEIEEVDEEEDEAEDDLDEEVDEEPTELIQLQTEVNLSEIEAELSFFRKFFFITSAISFAVLAFVIPAVEDILTKNVAAIAHLALGLLLMGAVLYEILTSQDFSLYVFGKQEKADRSRELISSAAIVLCTFFIGMANYVTPSGADKQQSYYIELSQEYMQIGIFSLSAVTAATVAGRIILNNTIPTYSSPAAANSEETAGADESEEKVSDANGEEEVSDANEEAEVSDANEEEEVSDAN